MRARFSTEWLAVGLVAIGLLSGAVLPGCAARNEQNGTASGTAGTDASITGSGQTTTGPGGEGAGMTGTEGDAPADNPAAEASEEQQKAEQ